MAGDATHGFDLVIEFAEQLFRDLLGVVFDTDGFLADILGGIGVPASVANTFQVEVAMDAPVGIALPAGATDFLDIHVFLGDGGSLGDLRIIAGVDVDRSSSTTDLVHIDLANRLFFTSISVAGFNIPGLNALLATRLRNTIRSIPLLPVPVTRGTTDPVKFDCVERRVIDDTRPEDRDALAALLTFGGGRVGNAAAFTSSFVSPGGRGGIAIGFSWVTA